MMHVSPCAWYCFQLPDTGTWEVKDQADRTWITAPDGTCGIEIAAARRMGASEENEIADVHERYLRDEGIQPVKTMMSENPCKVTTYVTRGLGMDEREHIICHAYWKNYCAFIRYHGRREAASNHTQAFYDLVESLQPLAVE
jgi:hypothetical protein